MSLLCLAHDMTPHGKILTKAYPLDSKPADSGPLRNGDVVIIVNTLFLVCTLSFDRHNFDRHSMRKAVFVCLLRLVIQISSLLTVFSYFSGVYGVCLLHCDKQSFWSKLISEGVTVCHGQRNLLCAQHHMCCYMLMIVTHGLS